MGLLEGYFVPLFNFFLIPEHFDHKVLWIIVKVFNNLNRSQDTEIKWKKYIIVLIDY